MASLEQRFKAFVKLGDHLRAFTAPVSAITEQKTEILPSLAEHIRLAGLHNPWFTEDNIMHALSHWAELLHPAALQAWLKPYSLKEHSPRTVAIIMAGNIPLVGFHDFLSVLISGERVLIKLASRDRILLPYLAGILTDGNPDLKEQIVFLDGKLKEFDAIIATGSNNTARYFEYYFRDKPRIIRKNRNAVAILQGMESQEELCALGEDIFRYFGLGCRSVSKLYVPEAYNFEGFFGALKTYESLGHHNKYANNYDYNRAVYLMNSDPVMDNGFLLLKEDPGLSSPIGSLFYEYYGSDKNLKAHLRAREENIQCIAGSLEGIQTIPFGTTQLPSLSDFADGIDTLEFLQGMEDK